PARRPADLLDAARLVPRHGAVLAGGRARGTPSTDHPNAPVDRRARPVADGAWRRAGGGGSRAERSARLAARPDRPARRARRLEGVDPAHDHRSPARAGLARGPALAGVGTVALRHPLQHSGHRAAASGRAGRRLNASAAPVSVVAAAPKKVGAKPTASTAKPAPSDPSPMPSSSAV